MSQLTRRELLKSAATLGAAAAVAPALGSPAQAQTTQKRELVTAQLEGIVTAPDPCERCDHGPTASRASIGSARD